MDGIHAMLQRGITKHLAAAGFLALLAACAAAPEPEASIAPLVADEPYPSLSSVPAPPRLPYSLAQRDQIAAALAADRARAEYDRAVSRYELGQSTTPPPAAPPAAVAEPEPTPGGVPSVLPDAVPPLPEGGGVIAENLVEQKVLTERNTGRISSFLRLIQRQHELNSEFEAAGFGVLPDGQAPTAPVAPAEAAGLADTLSWQVTFPATSSVPPDAAQPALREAAAASRAQGRGIIVTGMGASAGQRLERARAVALLLTQMGASARSLEVRTGGEGDAVLVEMLPAGTG